jgi:uncharacterized protein (DUF302 family)
MIVKKLNPILTGAIGLLLGIVLTALVGTYLAPSMMIDENLSSYSFDETIERIETAAEENGWKVPAVHIISNSVASGGYEVAPVAVIELCKVDLAGQILSEDESRVVSSMMPCRVSIYETSNGDVVVSRMNTALVSKLFGGNIQSLMATATAETEVILNSVISD